MNEGASDEQGKAGRRIPLSPRTRKFVAFAVLAAGALVVGQTLAPAAPREVELRVRLAPFRAPPVQARAIRVELARDGVPVQAVSERFTTSAPPVEWHRSVNLPPGDYSAQVNVELDGRTVARESAVHVGGGDAVDLTAPPAE